MKRRSFAFAALVFVLLSFLPAVDGGDKMGWIPVWWAYPALFHCLAAWDFWDIAGVSLLLIGLHVGFSAGIGIGLGRLEKSAKTPGFHPLSGEYWRAIQVSLCFQLFLGFVLPFMTDHGVMMQLWFIAMAAYWGGAALIVARRPAQPTKTDLFLLRWSFPVLMLAVATPLTLGIWHARGLLD